VVSNNGTANSVDIASSAFQMNSSSGGSSSPNLGFSSVQDSVGQSTMSNFVVYDSLGMPLNVRVTTALESRDGDATTYRWYAESGDNDPPGADHVTALGTGLISFDGEGNLIQGEPPSVALNRADIPSAQPLDFRLDFSNVSGFATDNAEIAATRQDGSPVGTLTSYNVGEDGRIMGVFSNGTTQTLGQVRLARFANPTGLVQHGENMYAVGFNSGLPVEGNPGELGLGSIISGAVELSNADIGTDLVDLMLASTQYRANSRVISTSQQLLDELMNMRR
jgi:flagellar hook protein FlgE